MAIGADGRGGGPAHRERRLAGHLAGGVGLGIRSELTEGELERFLEEVVNDRSGGDVVLVDVAFTECELDEIVLEVEKGMREGKSLYSILEERARRTGESVDELLERVEGSL